MIYLMSDIHGRYDEYKKMLELIDFKESDTLFVLGDMVDRSPKGMELLLDMMYRVNVYPIAGNHDLIALACLKELSKEITEESIRDLDKETMSMMIDWMNNLGGQATIDGFHKLVQEDRKAIVEYLGDLELYEELKVNGTDYVVVHTMGFNNFAPNKSLEEYSAEDLLDIRCDYGVRYYEDKILVTGHTPTIFIEEHQFQNTIYQGNGHIAMDCGMEQLGCLCLDTGEEYYVETIKE
ncbi:MAG: metallophosphoesterase [Eubacteriales bacterium]